MWGGFAQRVAWRGGPTLSSGVAWRGIKGRCAAGWGAYSSALRSRATRTIIPAQQLKEKRKVRSYGRIYSSLLQASRAQERGKNAKDLKEMQGEETLAVSPSFSIWRALVGRG